MDARLRALLQVLPLCATIRHGARLAFVNDRAAAVIGARATDVMGMRAADVFGEASEEWTVADRACLAIRAQTVTLHGGSGARWFRVTRVPQPRGMVLRLCEEVGDSVRLAAMRALLGASLKPPPSSAAVASLLLAGHGANDICAALNMPMDDVVVWLRRSM